MKDWEVEMIVPSASRHDDRGVLKKSFRGCLRQYANPALIDQEHEAWQDAVSEKYCYCESNKFCRFRCD